MAPWKTCEDKGWCPENDKRGPWKTLVNRFSKVPSLSFPGHYPLPFLSIGYQGTTPYLSSVHRFSKVQSLTHSRPQVFQGAIPYPYWFNSTIPSCVFQGTIPYPQVIPYSFLSIGFQGTLPYSILFLGVIPYPFSPPRHYPLPVIQSLSIPYSLTLAARIVIPIPIGLPTINVYPYD